MQSRDDAERSLTLVSAAVTQGFLARTLAAAKEAIATGVFRPGVQPVVALGTLLGWWTEAVDDRLVLSIRRAWTGAFAVNLNGKQVISPRADAMSFHLTAVQDRLSRNASPEIPTAAFEQVRLSQSAAALQGWSTKQQARDIAERLAWEPNKDYWKRAQAEAEAAIDAVLDPLGRPGSPARTYAHKNDPTVKFWQEVRAEAVARIREDESDWKTRAERIARTEATAAWNSGALAALAAEGRSHKMWLATTDTRTRQEHVLADRQVVPISAPFRVGGVALMMPGDPVAPPHLTVNCRCTVIGADAPTLNTDSLVASGGGNGGAWRYQLRIPRGNGSRSGRWTFTPWKHLDDLASLLGALGSNSEPDTRTRVATALQSLEAFSPESFDVHNDALSAAARDIATLLDGAEPENSDVAEAVRTAAAGIRDFGETDWSLFGESTDIGSNDVEAMPIVGGRATNKHLWEGSLPSDEAVNPDLDGKSSQWLADELARIKAHPVAPSPTARKKRAAYVKELSDRRDRDEQALTPEPAPEPEPAPTSGPQRIDAATAASLLAQVPKTEDPQRAEFMEAALQAYDTFPEGTVSVFAETNASGAPVAAAALIEVDLDGAPPFLKLDYLATTEPGHGRAMVDALRAEAQRRDLPLLLEPTAASLEFWKRMGAVEDPDGWGTELWGFPDEQVLTPEPAPAPVSAPEDYSHPAFGEMRLVVPEGSRVWETGLGYIVRHSDNSATEYRGRTGQVIEYEPGEKAIPATAKEVLSPTLEAIRADVSALALDRSNRGRDTQVLFDVLQSSEPLTPQALFDALNNLDVADDESETIDGLQDRLRALGAVDTSVTTPNETPVVPHTTPADLGLPSVDEILREALQSAVRLKASKGVHRMLDQAAKDARTLQGTEPGSPAYFVALQNVVRGVAAAAGKAPSNDAAPDGLSDLKRELLGADETLRQVLHRLPKSKFGTDTAVPPDVDPILDKWVQLRGSGNLTAEERSKLLDAVTNSPVRRAPLLFRGASLQNATAEDFTPGRQLNFGPSSASTDADSALPYAEFGDGLQVLFEFDSAYGSGFPGLNVQERAEQVGGYSEGEWVTGGPAYVSSQYVDEETGVLVVTLASAPGGRTSGRPPLDMDSFHENAPEPTTPDTPPAPAPDTPPAPTPAPKPDVVLPFERVRAITDTLDRIGRSDDEDYESRRPLMQFAMGMLSTALHEHVAAGIVPAGDFANEAPSVAEGMVQTIQRGSAEQFREQAAALAKIARDDSRTPEYWRKAAEALEAAEWPDKVLHEQPLDQRAAKALEALVRARNLDLDEADLALQAVSDLEIASPDGTSQSYFTSINGLNARRALETGDPHQFNVAINNLLAALREGDDVDLHAVAGVLDEFRTKWNAELAERAAKVENDFKEKYGSLPATRTDSATVTTDLGRYFPARSRNSNCVLASAVFEARRRGIDVHPKVATRGRPAYATYTAWFGLSREDRQQVEGLRGRQAKGKRAAIIKHFASQPDLYPPGSRGTIDVDWARGGGHIWNWEVDAAGHVRFYDAQTGEVDMRENNHLWREILGSRPVNVIRLDDKAISPNLEVAFAPAETSRKARQFENETRGAVLKQALHDAIFELNALNEKRPRTNAEYQRWMDDSARLRQVVYDAREAYREWQDSSSDLLTFGKDPRAFPALLPSITYISDLRK